MAETLSKITVVVDLRPLIGPAFGSLSGARTGVGEFIDRLVRELIARDHFHLILFSNSLQQQTLPYQGTYITTLHTHIPNRALDLTVRGLNAPMLDDLVERRTGKKVEVWLSPHITSAPLRRARKVVVVHDCSWLYPEFFSWRKRYWHWSMGLTRTLKTADRIIAVSAHTRQELLRHYRLPPDKVIMVYPGIDERFFLSPSAQELNAVRAKYRIPARSVLFLGTLEPRKNIRTLLQAFTAIAANSDADLVLAGETGWLTAPIMNAINTHPYATRIHRLGFVADGDKSVLYRLCSCFVYPSFYEGFGFPPLEALACGAPVVMSHATSLPEVVGTYALMVDPYDSEDIAGAIATALTNARYREWCAGEGPKRAIQFSWGRTAHQVASVIEETV